MLYIYTDYRWARVVCFSPAPPLWDVICVHLQRCENLFLFFYIDQVLHSLHTAENLLFYKVELSPDLGLEHVQRLLKG